MNKFFASTAIALLVAGPVAAQAQTGTVTAQTQSGSGLFVETAAATDHYGSDLIGKRLYVAETESDDSTTLTSDMRDEWDDIGEINDLVISEDGTVKAVLLDIGGFLGVGEKTVAVDMSKLRFIPDGEDADDYFVAFQGNTEMIESAPEFEPYETGETTAMTDQDAATPVTGDKAMAEDNGPLWDTPLVEREGYKRVEANELTADDLTGATVYDVNDDSIGEVSDLVITDDGKIEQAIVDVGGFLGMGEHSVAIAFDEMQIIREDDGDDLRVYVSASEEQLKERPSYNY